MMCCPHVPPLPAFEMHEQNIAKHGTNRKKHLFPAVVVLESAVGQEERESFADRKGTSFSLRFVVKSLPCRAAIDRASMELHVQPVSAPKGHSTALLSNAAVDERRIVHAAGGQAVERLVAF